jgi:hypothetical protein
MCLDDDVAVHVLRDDFGHRAGELQVALLRWLRKAVTAARAPAPPAELAGECVVLAQFRAVWGRRGPTLTARSGHFRNETCQSMLQS